MSRRDRSLIEREIALANLAQDPVDRLLDDIPGITGLLLDSEKNKYPLLFICYLMCLLAQAYHVIE